ncbi:hypothetical protein KBA73_04820, partial [Patescibacteria group bacterium]|nr:hypothetical protein [Patescibacteria group bacterium]
LKIYQGLVPYLTSNVLACDLFFDIRRTTGVNPLEDEAFSEKTERELESLFEHSIHEGRLPLVTEIQELTGWTLSEEQRRIVLAETFKNIFLQDLYRDSGAVKNYENLLEQDITYFITHGGDQLSLESRRDVLGDYFFSQLESLISESTPAKLLKLVDQLTLATERFIAPNVLLTGSVRSSVERLLYVQRYAFPYDYSERLPAILRLEALSGISGMDVISAPEALSIVKAAFERMPPLIEGKNLDLKPYFDAVFPRILTPSAREGLRGYIIRLTGNLARMGQNPSFPEQLEALRSWGFSEHLFEDKEIWLRQQVQEQGLLYDPYEGARALGLPIGKNFDAEVARYKPFDRAQKNELRYDEQQQRRFADEVHLAFQKESWPGAMRVLRRSEWPIKDALRIFRNLIHSHSLHFELFHRATADAEIVFESIARFRCSPLEKEQLVQEIYAAGVMRTKTFVDTKERAWLPAIQFTHPAIIEARATLTQEALRLKKIHLSGRGLQTAEKIFIGVNPVLLLPSEWSAEQIAVFSPYLSQGLLDDLKAVNRPVGETDEDITNALREEFSRPPESQTSWMSQMLIVYADRVDARCKTDADFKKVYELWLAYQIGSRENWSFEYAERFPGYAGSTWSFEAYASVIRGAIKRGSKELIELVMKRAPALHKQLLERVHECIKEELPKRMRKVIQEKVHVDLSWSRFIIEFYPDAIASFQREKDFPWEEYMDWIATLYEKRMIPGVVRVAPGVDTNHKRIQQAMMCAAIESIGTTEHRRKVLGIPETEPELIHWQNPEVREMAISPVSLLLPSFLLFEQVHRKGETLRSAITRCDTFQKLSGYRVAHPDFHDIPGINFVSSIGAYIDRWEYLAKELGSEPSDRTGFYQRIQEKIDECCRSFVNVTNDFLNLKRTRSLEPSEEALRERLNVSLRPGRDVSEGIELFRALGYSMELSVEEIQKISPASARSEALIYTCLLPKQGPARLAAEKAYKERSGLAGLIPQLLAIQSPTKRGEFCPYENELRLLLEQLNLTLLDEAQNKGLILFLKEFGMRNLPTLARAIIALSLGEEKRKESESGEVDELNGLLGITTETLTLDEYLARIHELVRSVRQAMLEDKPFPPAIERTKLGMELFNAIVPNAGEYQAVDDRPALLATIRSSETELVAEPWYKPASKLVAVVEQEQASFKEATLSPTEQAIMSRRMLLKKKYGDESMQHFAHLWNEAFELIKLEYHGRSRSFWFSIIAERLEKQQLALEQKQQEVKQEQAIKALTKQRERLALLEERVRQLIGKDLIEEGGSINTEDLLEELQSLFINSSGKVDRVELEKQAGDVARSLVLILMRGHSPGHFAGVFLTLKDLERVNGMGYSSPAVLNAWEKWFREEFLEHFAGFNPDSDVPLSGPTRLLMQKLWRIDGITADIEKKRNNEKKGPVQHPLIDCFEPIRRLEQEIEQLEKNEQVVRQQPLEFWPVKGIGRVLAGDIANACYHTHRERLARGEEPGLTALLMTLPGNDELAGSTLFI